MDSRETKRTVPVPSVGADGEQPNSQTTTQSIAEETAENNPQEKDLEEMLRDMRRMNDPAYLHTVSMNDLYQNIYQSRPPVIDGLLYPGTYLFAGAPKVGKSFLMAQLAYHVSMGLPLWGYPVHKGTVLYLALEDDHRRLQGRLYRMFGMDGTNDLLFAIYAKQLGLGLEEQLKEQLAAVHEMRSDERRAQTEAAREQLQAKLDELQRRFDERAAALGRTRKSLLRGNPTARSERYTEVLERLKKRLDTHTHR